MRILAAVQAIFAAAFLLFGIVTVFAIGITGLLFLIPGVVFAAIAGVAVEKSRGAVALSLAADALLAYFAAARLQALLNPERVLSHLPPQPAIILTPGVLDFVVPAGVLALVACAVIGVLFDWRAVRSSSWFS